MRVELAGKRPLLDAVVPVTDDAYRRSLVIDTRALAFASPLELVVIGALATDWRHRADPVELILPEGEDPADYLCRMDVVKHLEGCGAVVTGAYRDGERADRSDRLLELSQVRDAARAEQVNGAFYELVERHCGAGTAKQAFRVVGELLNNGFEHSGAPTGTFAAAQVYTSGRGRSRSLQLAVADAGIGILEHLRQREPLESSSQAIERALTDGVTGLKDKTRGRGLSDVLTVGRNYVGRLHVRSADGIGVVDFKPGADTRAFHSTSSSLPGTWSWMRIMLP